MRSVVYPGTFDPITNGHMDLIQRASSLFDRVVVAVAVDTGKDPAFGIHRRLELAEQALRGIPEWRWYAFPVSWSRSPVRTGPR